MRLVLIGPPGAGKGTVGSMLALHERTPHITTGGMIREQIALGTSLGKRFDEAISQGDFLPDSDMIALVRRRLSQPDAVGGFILDGFPRDLAQAESFAATPEGAGLDTVVVLNLAEPEIVKRLSGRLVCPRCGASYQVDVRPPKHAGQCDNDGAALARRPDDGPQAIIHRIDVYKKVTVPVIEYYNKLGLVKVFDADLAPGEIVNQITASLGTG